jgi:hypothetical protein
VTLTPRDGGIFPEGSAGLAMPATRAGDMGVATEEATEDEKSGARTNRLDGHTQLD